MKQHAFIDAQAMARANPATFKAPAPAALAAIRPGMFAKICASDERFWVQVTHVNGDQLGGSVNNRLVRTDAHGLRDGDAVSFELRHVFQIEQ